MTNQQVRCSACMREPAKDENVFAEWRTVPSGQGKFHVLCPTCEPPASRPAQSAA